MTDQASVNLHRPYEDVAAILTGTLMVALGVTSAAVSAARAADSGHNTSAAAKTMR